MNRLWNLWCGLSGIDPSNQQLKMDFNIDRRIAILSALAPDLVEEVARSLWLTNPATSQDEFLEMWLARASGRREQGDISQHFALPSGRAEEPEHQVATRRKVESLYNIASVANLASIASRGILCHDFAATVRHEDLSDQNVQGRRDNRTINGIALHKYANLFFNPRNAMLYRLHKFERHDVVVLEISADVLNRSGVVATDGNAASAASRWALASNGLDHIDFRRVHERTWNSPDGEADLELKRIMQAEVLVPGLVAPKYIDGFIAPTASMLEQALAGVGHWRGRVDKDTFFDSGSD